MRTVPGRNLVVAVGRHAAPVLAATALWTLSQPAAAQNFVTPSARYAAESDAIKESVPVRSRPEFAPLGILVGDLMDGMGANAAAGAGANGLTPLPTPQSVTPTKLRPLDSADSETGLFATGGVAHPTRPSDFLGSFILRPRLLVDAVYDDNVFRSDLNKQSDLITIARPSLRLQSDWYNHALNITASGAIGRYADFSAEDFEDYAFSIEPRVDITDSHIVDARLAVSRNHEDRSGVEAQLQGTVPSVNTFWDSQIGWTYSGPSLSSILGYTFRRQDAENAGVVDRQVFDKDIHTAQWRLGWHFSPGRTVWLQPEYQIVEHRLFDAGANFDRDNRGWQVLTGITFDFSAVTFLEAGVGYVTRTFEEPTKSDFSAPAYRLRGVWNVTSLITLDLSAGRVLRVEDGVTAAASVTDEVSLKAAWDPLEQLIVSGALSYAKTEFEDLPGFSRNEDQYSAKLNLRYLLTENFFFEADYQYTSFDSTVAGDKYGNNQLRLRAGMEL